MRLDGSSDSQSQLAMPPTRSWRWLHRKIVLGRRFDASGNPQLTKQVSAGGVSLGPWPGGERNRAVVVRCVGRTWPVPHLPRFHGRGCPWGGSGRGAQPAPGVTGTAADDPYTHRVAPQCTPLATTPLHAVRPGPRRGSSRAKDTVAPGDARRRERPVRATTHEAPELCRGLECRRSPSSSFRNNGYADKRAAGQADGPPRPLAHKGIGYGHALATDRRQRRRRPSYSAVS